MEVLDTLYGVTMQEPELSKVVGVDLSKSLPVHLQKSFESSTPNVSTPKNLAIYFNKFSDFYQYPTF